MTFLTFFETYSNPDRSYRLIQIQTDLQKNSNQKSNITVCIAMMSVAILHHNFIRKQTTKNTEDRCNQNRNPCLQKLIMV